MSVMNKLPNSFYDIKYYGKYGWTALHPIVDANSAFSSYTHLTAFDGCDVKVFFVTMDFTTNEHESTREVTSEFQERLTEEAA